MIGLAARCAPQGRRAAQRRRTRAMARGRPLVAFALKAVSRHAAARAGVSTGARRDRRAGHPGRRRHPVVPRLPRLSRQHLRIGERPIVHGIPSATKRSRRRPGVDRLRGDPRRLARRRRCHLRVGSLPRRRRALSAACRERWTPGSPRWCRQRLTDVSHAVETGTHAAEARYGRQVRHRRRVRRARHRPSDAHGPVPAQRGPTRPRPHLAPGSVLAIEPMLTLGTTKTGELDDEWTVVTADGCRAAHWEHTVAVTDDGPRILTV